MRLNDFNNAFERMALNEDIINNKSDEIYDKLRTMRKISRSCYRNADNDCIMLTGQRKGTPMWFIEIDGDADGYFLTKEEAFKAFADEEKRRARNS